MGVFSTSRILFLFLLCNFFISCTDTNPKTAKNISTDTIPKSDSSKRETVLPLIDSTLILSNVITTKYKGKNLTTEMAKHILYSYFKKSGSFIEDSLPEKLSESDYQKTCIRFDTIYKINFNNDEYDDAIITYWLKPPIASGHCWQPHKSLIVDRNKGYEITNEDFIPEMFMIDSVVIKNKLTTIFCYDYDCGGTDSISCRFKLTLASVDSSKINKIKRVVEQIDKDHSYTTKKLENEDFMGYTSDRGGDLTGYFKNGKLVKMVEWIGLSSCVNITEYYLQDDKLIFAYTNGFEFQYVDSIATFNSTQELKMECRFYFENDLMIKSILKGATRCGGPPMDSWAKTDLEESVKYGGLFKKK